MARKAVRRVDPEQRARLRKRYLIFGIPGLVVLVLLVVLLRLGAGPSLPRDVQQRIRSGSAGGTVAPPPAGAIPSGTPTLPQQLAQLEYASRSGDTRPQTLYVSDSELNAMLVQSFHDETVSEPRCYFSNGKVYMVGVVHWRGMTLNLTATAVPVIVNGGVRFSMESVMVGSQPAPAAVTARLQEEANKNTDALSPSQTGLYVQSVDIRNGVAVLNGSAAPRGR